MPYVSSNQARSFFSVSDSTLRKWAENKELKFKLTKGGHRRYWIDRKTDQKESETEKRCICYARVSSLKQENELDNQIDFLQDHKPEFEIFEDVGSGINFKRKKFRKILKLLFAGVIEEVVVSSRDRFTRFGFELFEWIFWQFGAKLTVIKKTDDQESFTEDLISILTTFTASYHGKRSYSLSPRKTNYKKNKKGSSKRKN